MTQHQHVADFLYSTGYKPETIVEYLEGMAAAGRIESFDRITIGDTIYDWKEATINPRLYEFDKVEEEKVAKRPKVWRAIGWRRRARTRVAPHRARFTNGVNIGIDGSRLGGFDSEG